MIPELEQRYIDDVLSGKRDSFMTSVYVAGVPMMLTAAPIQYENKIRGAIISLYRNASVRKNDADELHSYYLKGYVAHAHFLISGSLVKKWNTAWNFPKCTPCQRILC